MMAFFVMQGASLRNVSTCFYMSVLALVDTGGPSFTQINN